MIGWLLAGTLLLVLLGLLARAFVNLPASDLAQAFRTFLAKNYHQPSDQTDLPFNWEAGAKFARLNYLIARDVADAPEAPRWYAGNRYGDRFARGAPRAVRPVQAGK